MNTQRPLTPLERDRAISRLRRLTLGTALVGVAAVAGFGSVAAITFPGHSGGSSAASTSVAGAVSAGTGTSTAQATTQATTGSSAAVSNLTTSTTSLSTTSGSAHVVTGGS